MPFDEEDNDQPSAHSQKVGLKSVSSQKSIFDNKPKKPSNEEFEGKVKQSQEYNSYLKTKGMNLSIDFKKMMADKTLSVNKSIFTKEIESELLKNMIHYATEVNNTANEPEGAGSLTCIILLLRTCFYQRDKINDLEYSVFSMKEKINEISQALDKLKKNE